MRKATFFVIFFLSISTFSFSSADIRDRDSSRYLLIAISPSEMMYGYTTVYLKYKLARRWAMEIGAGHIFSHPRFFSSSRYDEDKPGPAYSGTVIRYSVKYFLGKNPGPVYVGLMTTYRNLSYSNKYFEVPYAPGEDVQYQFRRSETANQIGESLIFGCAVPLSSNVFFEAYTGIGISYRFRDYYTHSWYGTGGYNPLMTGMFHETQQLFPAHFGIKFAIKVHEKK